MKENLHWHIIGWSLFVLYDYQQSFMNEAWSMKDFVIVMSHNAILITSFYFTYSFLCKRFFKLGTLKFALIAIPAAVLFFIGLRYSVQEVLFRALFGFGNYYNTDILPYFLDNLWRGFTPFLGGLVFFLLDEKNKSTQAQAQLATERNSAELAFLRTQLNPHFLFNTLSFLHTQAFVVDQKLADTILKLSEVLRYSIQSSTDEKVSIKEEIQLLNNYIDIFRQRFEGACFINFEVEGTDLYQRIEPLLLMPFIENAFKHGVHTDPDRPIEAKLQIEGGRLIFNCKNEIKRQTKDPGSGIGLENVKRRLNLLYPDQHELNISEDKDTFSIVLSVAL
jgi:hypothetical protein